ncbi:hypothetical protein BM525_19605 (plasmid) [Alteromonas mediterranea]|uniref:Uncharacterized protein n=1 Tax=Alteromonas mediterranea TaxID=314275 RepID=A0AAC9JGH1_9ALTE|nr:hypothetical protein [Alteromonas mediterranea]APD92090.1 hypothetical protein BM524_19410 [Alteromonas mediterranea]APD99944.1 hypothetical protein BM525_19605 [Alteromonas mediterranea]
MSTREHEQGEIQFTKTGYSQFVRILRAEINGHLTRLYNGALVVHAELAKIKGRGAFDKQRSHFEKYIQQPRDNSGWGYDSFPHQSNKVLATKLGHVPLSEEMKDWIENELFERSNNRLTKPRKSTLPILNNKQTDFRLDCDDGVFRLDPTLNSLIWYVGENNHAVRDAHNSVGYSIFAKAINKYVWKRKEGGVFYYGNEYDEESARDGCRIQDRVSCSFGPEGVREKFESLGHPKKQVNIKVKEFLDKQKQAKH